MKFSVENVSSVVSEVANQLNPVKRKRRDEQRKDAESNTRKPGLTNVDRTDSFTVTGDKQLAIYDIGPVDADTTVVYVHGFTLAADSFFLEVEELREQYPHVRQLLWDLPGHGNSPEFDSYSIDDAGHYLIQILEHYLPQGRFMLVGHSMGGMISFNAIRRMSDDLRKRLVGLVQISTAIDQFSDAGVTRLLGTDAAEKILERVQDSPDEVDDLRRKLAKVLAPTLATTVFRRKETDYDLVEFHAYMINNTPLKTMLGYTQDLREHDENGVASRLEGLPGWVLVGDGDDVTPEGQAERIQQVWPTSKNRCVEKTGHMLILEAPDVVTEAIESLLP